MQRKSKYYYDYTRNMSYEDAEKFYKKNKESNRTKSLKKSLGLDVLIEVLEEEKNVKRKK